MTTRNEQSREHLLKLFTKHPTPSLDAGLLSVRDVKLHGEGAVRVGGRWAFEDGCYWIESDGERIELSVESGRALSLNLAGHSFPALANLRSGDIVAVSGQFSAPLNFTVEGIELLVPCLRPLFPSEISGGFSFARSEDWQLLLHIIRGFFIERDFLEMRTPTLVPSPGMEPYLESFSTLFVNGRSETSFYLPTSPEFHLKKLLALGWTKIFEFKECFRNGHGELTPHHQPEFLMLEWYRGYSNLRAIADDLSEMLKACTRVFRPEEIFEVRRVSVSELFREHAGFELKPESTRDELAAAARLVGVEVAKDDTFDDVFFRIFLEKIEPKLGQASVSVDGHVGNGPVIVYNYPPSQAALARLTADGWADRFELFWEGLEIANAFHELNDAEEQRRRFIRDTEVRRRAGKRPVPVDEEFLRALEYGLPPSGGIALGMDRLFMALLRLPEISETRAFPLR